MTKSHNDKIIAHLMKRRTITKARAFLLGYGISLNSRISELRQLGYPIRDRWVKRTNIEGNEVRYKEYYMDEEYIAKHTEK